MKHLSSEPWEQFVGLASDFGKMQITCQCSILQDFSFSLPKHSHSMFSVEPNPSLLVVISYMWKYEISMLVCGAAHKLCTSRTVFSVNLSLSRWKGMTEREGATCLLCMVSVSEQRTNDYFCKCSVGVFVMLSWDDVNANNKNNSANWSLLCS